MALNRRAKAKIYTTHLRYPQFSTNDVVCALLLYVDRIFVQPQSEGKNSREFLQNSRKSAWVFLLTPQLNPIFDHYDSSTSVIEKMIQLSFGSST